MAENAKVIDHGHTGIKNDARNSRRNTNNNRGEKFERRDNSGERFERRDNRGPPIRGPNNDNQWSKKDYVKEKLQSISGPTTDLTTKEGVASKKFTGRCRLFVGNLPTTITEDEFRKMFEPFGELGEVFLNKQNGFGFVRLDTRQNAENAKSALDFSVKDAKQLRVRYATHGAALKIKNLPSFVSNELLEAAFTVFGDVERAIIIVDDRERPVGEGIVEFTRKQSAQLALKRCSEGCFLLTSSPRPIVVEPLDYRDEEDGLPEKNFQKNNNQYLKEREMGPRFAEPGTFEYEFANRWKRLYDLEKQKRDYLEKEIEEGRHALADQMEFALYDHEANLLREKLRHMEEQSSYIQRERELRREEEMRREEVRRQQEMMLRQQQDEILRSDIRRRQEENMMMQDPAMMRNMGLSSLSPANPPDSLSVPNYNNSMLPGAGLGHPPQRPSRFDQPPPTGDSFMPPGEQATERPDGNAGEHAGVHGTPLPPHEMMDNMEFYGAKRRRY